MATAIETAAVLPVVIPLAKIDTDWKHNASRQFVNEAHKAKALAEMWESQGYKDLRNSIRDDGLKHPLIVRRSGVKGGKAKEFILVAGFRRSHALEELKHTDAPCIIEPDSTDDAKAFLLNVKENVIRESVTKFQVATAAVEFYERFGKGGEKKDGASSGDVSKDFGVSSSYLRQIVMVRRNCPEPLLIAWAQRDEDEDAATFKATTWPRMLDYAGMKDKDGKPDHKAMLAAFELERWTVKLQKSNVTEEDARKEAKEMLEKGGYHFDPLTGEEETGGGKGKSKSKSVPIDELKAIRKSVKGTLETRPPTEAALCEAVIAALDYILAKSHKGKSIKVGKVVIYEPPRGDVK